jgi:hypothetical protein
MHGSTHVNFTIIGVLEPKRHVATYTAHLLISLIKLSLRPPGSSVGIATELRAGLSRDQIPVEAKFSALVQSGPEANPASCTMGTGCFRGAKSGRGVNLTPHPLLVPWSRKGRAIPLLPLWAVRPVQSLSVCTVELYLYSPYGLYGLYRASVPVQ